MELKTVDIKGKAYVPVAERIKAFWEKYPDGDIITEIISNFDGTCVMKASIYINGKLRATGHACEKENTSYLNKVSFLENCETSCIGRAMGILGIGLDGDIASAEEVGNAIYAQTTTADKTKIDAMKKFIQNHNLQERAEELLGEYGYENIDEIKLCDFITIGNILKKEAKQ